jgi:hypothetical protein
MSCCELSKCVVSPFARPDQLIGQLSISDEIELLKLNRRGVNWGDGFAAAR